MTTALVYGFRGQTATADLAVYNAYVAEQIALWHSAFTKIGLTRDASIGVQLNPTAPPAQAALPPLSTYTDLGYTWYKFTDELSATEPIGIRVTWNVRNLGVAGSFSGSLAPKFETGIPPVAGSTAFVGSPVTSNFQYRYNDGGVVTADIGYFSYTGDYLMIALPGTLNIHTTGWMTVERWKDPLGADPFSKGIVVNHRASAQNTIVNANDQCYMIRLPSGILIPDSYLNGSTAPYVSANLSTSQGVSEPGKMGALWRPMLSERGYTVENTLFTRAMDYPFGALIENVSLISGGKGRFLALTGLAVGDNGSGGSDTRVVRFD